MIRHRYRTARNLIGIALLLMLLFVYAFAASMIGEYLVPDDAKIVQALYFVVAGIGWIVPAMVVIKWMLKPGSNGTG